MPHSIGFNCFHRLGVFSWEQFYISRLYDSVHLLWKLSQTSKTIHWHCKFVGPSYFERPLKACVHTGSVYFLGKSYIPRSTGCMYSNCPGGVTYYTLWLCLFTEKTTTTTYLGSLNYTHVFRLFPGEAISTFCKPELSIFIHSFISRLPESPTCSTLTTEKQPLWSCFVLVRIIFSLSL